MKFITLPVFEPENLRPDTAANSYIPELDIPTDLDLIEPITGHPNLTHAWNRFGLNAEVVERLLSSRHT